MSNFDWLDKDTLQRTCYGLNHGGSVKFNWMFYREIYRNSKRLLDNRNKILLVLQDKWLWKSTCPLDMSTRHDERTSELFQPCSGTETCGLNSEDSLKFEWSLVELYCIVITYSRFIIIHCQDNNAFTWYSYFLIYKNLNKSILVWLCRKLLAYR